MWIVCECRCATETIVIGLEELALNTPDHPVEMPESVLSVKLTMHAFYDHAFCMCMTLTASNKTAHVHAHNSVC